MLYRDDLAVRTGGRKVFEITEQIQGVVAASGAEAGLCNVFLHHTSASLVLCENADPTVLRDLESFFARLVPDGDPIFHHTSEGPDDMPAHVRTILTQNSLTMPFRKGTLDLGTWQGVFLWEHRHHPHRRRVTVSVMS